MRCLSIGTMKTLLEEFTGEVEAFLRKGKGMDATTFGKLSLRDPKFVFDIRKGRSPTARIIDKVRTFIKTYKAPK